LQVVQKQLDGGAGRPHLALCAGHMLDGSIAQTMEFIGKRGPMDAHAGIEQQGIGKNL
jgi:hypothetical protein